MQRDANGQHFIHGKQLFVCQSLIFYKRRGRRGNVSHFCSWKHSNWCFQHVAGSAYGNLVNAEGCEREHFTHGKQKPVYRFLTLCKRRGRRGNVAFFWSWKRSDGCFQRVARSAHCNFVAPRCHCERGHFPMAIKLLIAVRWFIACAHCKRATQLSRVSIGAYNALL